MSNRDVNPFQLKVLRWVADGCPDDVMTGESHKVSAAALKSRRLVAITKRRGVWSATLTDAGRYFLEHDDYPEGHWPSPSPAPMSAVRARLPGRVAGSKTANTRKPTELRPMAKLIADVIAADGELSFTAEDRPEYSSSLVKLANRGDKLPEGKWLQEVIGRRWGEYTVRLVDQPEWMTSEPPKVKVRSTLRSADPVIAEMNSNEHIFSGMSRGVRSRALRILDAVARAARQQSFEVQRPTDRSLGGHQVRGDLIVARDGHEFGISVTEKIHRTEHVPTAEEKRRKERHSWATWPQFDYKGSGRLSVTVNGGGQIRKEQIKDGKRALVEDQLPIVLQEIGLRADDAVRREELRRQEEAERRREWEQVRDRAVERARDDHRAETLKHAAAQWKQHQQMGEFLDAVRGVVDQFDDERRAATQQWIDWCADWLQRRDPLAQRLELPEDPEFTAEQLKPYMRGWSPYGPERTWF